MTSKKISRINRLTPYGSEYPAGRYNFVFSDDINIWIGAKTTRERNKRERAKNADRRRDFHLKHG